MRVLGRKMNWKSACVIFAFVYIAFDPAAARAQAEDQIPAAAIVDERFSEVGPFFPKGRSEFIGVGRVSNAAGPSHEIITFDVGGTIKVVGPLDAPRGALARSIRIAGSTALPDGGFILVGSALLESKKANRHAGWAARIGSDGGLVWNRTWEAEPTVELSEVFRFALVMNDDLLLLGGSMAEGEHCSARSQGVLFPVDLGGGNPVGERSIVSTKSSLILVDGKVLPTGHLFLAGWERYSALLGFTCEKKLWLATADTTAQIRSSRVLDVSSSDDSLFTSVEGAHSVTVAANAQRGGITKSARTLMYTLDLPNLRVLDAQYVGGGRGLVSGKTLKAGDTRYHVVTKSRTAPAAKGIEARLSGGVGSCNAEYRISAKAEGEMDFAGLAGNRPQSLIAYGSLQSSLGAPKAWLADLAATPTPEIGQVGKNYARSWLADLEFHNGKYTFEVVEQGRYAFVARQFDGDVDLYLMEQDGRVVAASDNLGPAAEYLVADLGPGTYKLVVAGRTVNPSAMVSIRAVDPGASVGNRPFEWDDETFWEALEVLGYRSSPESFGSSEQPRALTAFLASRCGAMDASVPPILFAAAGRRIAHEARETEREAPSSEDAPKGSVIGELEQEKHTIGSLKVKPKQNAPGVSVSRIELNVGEVITAEISADASSTGNLSVPLDRVQRKIAWTNHRQDKLFADVSGRRTHIFGGIENDRGAIAYGLLGSAQSLFGASEPLHLVLGDRVREVDSDSAEASGEQDSAWTTALWKGNEKGKKSEAAFSWPLKGGKVVETFSANGKGIRLEGKNSQKVLATADGRVLFSGKTDKGLGSVVIVQHENSYTSVYAETENVLVKTGELVTRDQEIAVVRSADSNEKARIYVEVRLDNKTVDPVELFNGKMPEKSNESADSAEKVREDKDKKQEATAKPDEEDKPDRARDGSGQLRWPLRGKIISTFGPRPDGTHNDGVNVAAPMGSDIKAADAGVIAYAGDELKGYGNLTLIRHDNGWVTAYAHADELLVKRGDRIKRGQVIAKVGRSGQVDQPQLHFELRQGQKPVDPLPFLGE